MYLIIICFFNGSSHELPDPETPKICSCILAAHQGAWAMLTCLCICILANLKIAYGIAFACTLTFLIRVRQWHPLHEKIGAERTLLHVSQNVRCPKCILGVTCPMGAGRASPGPETCSQSLPADEKQDAQSEVLPFEWSHPFRSHAISPQKVTQDSIPREKHAYVQLNGKEFPVVWFASDICPGRETPFYLDCIWTPLFLVVVEQEKSFLSAFLSYSCSLMKQNQVFSFLIIRKALRSVKFFIALL